MFGVTLISIATLIWCFTCAGYHKFYHNYTTYSFMLFILLCFLIIPALEGHSLINLIYSFFDSPSYLSLIWSILFISKMALRDLFKITLSASYQVSHLSVAILFLFGTIYYTSALGIFSFNLHYTSTLVEALITLSLCLLIFLFDETLFIMLIISLIPFAFFNYQNLTIVEFILCPYLWFFCGIKTVGMLLITCVKWMKHLSAGSASIEQH